MMEIEASPDYQKWVTSVPSALREDVLWRMQAYRLAVYVGDLGWNDVQALSRNHTTAPVAGQVYRALGSISANIAEGMSRSTGLDRARFLEYALGSARESREWHHKSRHILGANVVQQRIDLLTSIIKLLLVSIPRQRHNSIRETTPEYTVDGE